RRERSDQGRGLEARDERGVVAGVHHHGVGDEEQVEFSALGDLRARLHHRPAAVARGRPLVAPAGGVVAGPEPEHAEMHLALHCRHGDRSPLSPRAALPAQRAAHCSRRMFFLRTMVAHFLSSVRTLAASTSGPPPTGAMPSFPSASRTRGAASTALVLRLRRSTIAGRVPAGANRPNQTMVSKPGSPDSEIVGRSGSTGARSGAATPSIRTLPASTYPRRDET